MAKLKVKLRPSTVMGKAGTIYYYVSHKKVVRHISTNIHLLPSDWNEESGTITRNVPDFESLQNRIDSDFATLQHIIRELEVSPKNYSTDDIINRFKQPNFHISVLDFIQEQITFLKDCKKLGTAQNYQRTLYSLRSFLDGKSLMFTELTHRFVDSYNDFLLRKGLVKNSISFYMRILRAIYNKAVRRGMVNQIFPFKEVYTGIDKTRKLAVNENFIKQIIDLDLSENSALSFTRDLFLFSFYARGMAFVDMAFLKKSDLFNDIICYTRHKTGQTLFIKIEPCIRLIIDKYSSEVRDSQFVFPILKSLDLQENYKQYKNRLRAYNSHLKQLALKIGSGINISSYTSRHTWASVARNHNIPLSVISAGMGHSSEKTTEIYLKSIENSLVDGANKEILNSVNSLALNKK